jgi:ketosteroid isomerase-like protein
MLKSLFLIIALAATCFAQEEEEQKNANTAAQQRRTRARQTANANKEVTKDQTTKNANAARSDTRRVSEASRNLNANAQSAQEDPTSRGVVAAFNALLNGIRRANVEAVTNAYWKSSQLLLFNNNGTVTRGWEQMHENRASSYPEMKDVKLDIKDMRVQMLGRDSALITCLWMQSQTFRGKPESASGRMTIIFRRIGDAWKAIHLHTSPDAPDPSRLLPSERTGASKT